MTYTEAVQLALDGNERGFGFLYQDTYKSKLYLALQYMKNESDAEDVLQDAYVKAFSNLKDLKDPEKFSSWLGQIVANTAKNALVKKNPVLFTDIPTDEDEGEPFEEQIADEDTSTQPELSYTREETRQMVDELIDSLSDEQRVCILMYHMEDMPIKDIAAALDCSESTVKSRLNYGRKNLKAKVEELQKKGYKLYGLAPLALLTLLLHTDAEAAYADPSFSAVGRRISNEVFDEIPALNQDAPSGTGEAQAETAEEAGEEAETTSESGEAGEAAAESGESGEAGEEAATETSESGEASDAVEGELKTAEEAGEEAGEETGGTTEAAGESMDETQEAAEASEAGEEAAEKTAGPDTGTAAQSGETETGAGPAAQPDGEMSTGTGPAPQTGEASKSTGPASQAGETGTGTGATAQAGGSGAGTAAKAGAGNAAKAGFLGTTAGKVVIGAAVVIVAGGAIFGISRLAQNNDTEQEVIEEPAVAEEPAAAAPEEEAEVEAEEEEEIEEIPVTQEMYPELLEGGLTKQQFEVALAYAPAEVEDGEIDKDDLFLMVVDICYDFSDLCFGGYDDYSSDEMHDHYICSLDAVNNFLSVLTDTKISASNAQGWEDDLIINGDTVDVTLYDGEWMTPYANITDAVLWDDMMIVVYEIRSTGGADYYPDGTGTRTALLTQTDDGGYRVNRIVQGTPEEIYHTDRQEILAFDEGGWINEIIYYDLVSLEGTNDSHQAINDGLEADYQNFLSYTERATGMTISEIQASKDYLYHYVGAGVTNIQDGVFSVRFDRWTLEEDAFKRQYGLTYSLETGEQLGIRDLTDLSDEELLSRIKTALRDYISGFTHTVSSVESNINNYTLDDITSGINYWNSGRLSFFVQDDEIYILVPPGEFFAEKWTNYAVPTGIYISGAEVQTADAAASVSDDDYFFPDSDSRYLSRSELVNLTDEELQLARNEIYARHGRKFNTPSVQEYFDTKSWYHGTIEPDDFDESVLNDYETTNALLIREYEQERGS